MKILILAQLVTYSGVGVYIKQLSRELCELGDEVHVLSAKFDFELDERVICHSFLPLVNSNLIKNYRIFKSCVCENQIDVVHIQHRIVGIYPKLYNLIKLKVPCTYILHTGKLEQNNFLKRIFTYSGERVIAISSEVKECCIQELKIDERKISLVYNGVDNLKLKPISNQVKMMKRKSLGIEGDKFVICVHGRIDAVKGHDLLIEAINLLEDTERNRIHIIVSGNTKDNAYYEQIKQRIESLGIDNQFQFIGWCDPQDILSVSDLMVQPSRREGFLLSAIEAFFMRVPVIRTYTGGWYDMRECCIGIDIDDCEQLKKEISSFLKSTHNDVKKDEYSKMIDKAEIFANSNCTIRVMTECTRKIFVEIVDENKKS